MKKNRKFHGIKIAVGEMPRRNNYDGTYLEVHYDMDEDEVYTQHLNNVRQPAILKGCFFICLHFVYRTPCLQVIAGKC